MYISSNKMALPINIKDLLNKQKIESNRNNLYE